MRSDSEGATNGRGLEGELTGQTKKRTFRDEKRARIARKYGSRGDTVSPHRESYNMSMRLCMWNVDGVGSRGREVKSLVQTYEPDVLVLTELMSVDMKGMEMLGSKA